VRVPHFENRLRIPFTHGFIMSRLPTPTTFGSFAADPYHTQIADLLLVSYYMVGVGMGCTGLEKRVYREIMCISKTR
jgi:hypothetical protein